MPQLKPRQSPPPDYYADNLGFVLDEVERRNRDLLAPPELALISAWRAACVPARRLFARLLTRKGPWLRADRLDYAEVPDTSRAIAELRALGLVTVNPPAAADVLLNLFTRVELARLFPRVRAAAKPAWIDACVARYPDGAIRTRIEALHPWLAIAAPDAFAVCRLLFFGSDRHDLTDFVLQDLGMLRFERYEIGSRTRPFGDRAEIEQYRNCRALAAWLDGNHADRQTSAVIRQHLWTPVASRPVARLRNRLLNRLGYLHERRGEFDEALESYGLSETHPARERRARLLLRLGDEVGYQHLIEEAAAAPWSAEEEDFVMRARSRRERSGAAVGATVTELTLDPGRLADCAGGAIERFALILLADDGARGWHLENHLPLGLAGILFWDEVFAPVAGAFSHPLQLGPRDLFWPDFARLRAAAIEARMAGLRTPTAFRARLTSVADQKRGIANRLVHWGAWSPDLIEALTRVECTDGLLAIAHQAILDLQRTRTGFPDLTVIGATGELEFVEVKGPTDQLQPAQRTWLRTLERLGLRARVMKFRA